VADRYLGSPLSFAQARLLYEIAVLAPLATHHLRRLLAVDPAALSRGSRRSSGAASSAATSTPAIAAIASSR